MTAVSTASESFRTMNVHECAAVPLACEADQVGERVRLLLVHAALPHQRRGGPQHVPAKLVRDLLVAEPGLESSLGKNLGALIPRHVGCPSRALAGRIVGDCASGSRSNQRIRSLNRTTSPMTMTAGGRPRPRVAAGARPPR